MEVYLDNAATTSVDPQVVEAMLSYLDTHVGNPSSTHSHGRKIRAAIEGCRNQMAILLGITPSELFFTSGGTESINHIINKAIDGDKIKQIISSPIEHHAVLDSIEIQQKIPVKWIQLNEYGEIDLAHLESLLQEGENSFVSLMQVNNELGNIYDTSALGKLCKQYDASYFVDATQGIGHIPLNIKKDHIDFSAGSAHKFHGPKGSGFLTIDKEQALSPLLLGGAQERNMRGGTENVSGIVGMAKALEIALADFDKNNIILQTRKDEMIKGLQEAIPNIRFNGLSENKVQSSPHLLNVYFPDYKDTEMLLLNLDINDISASAGSACSSGSALKSHVIEHLHPRRPGATIRFSFSKFTSSEEITYTVKQVKEITKRS